MSRGLGDVYKRQDYNAIYKGLIFTVISIALFFLTYYFEISVIPYRPTTEETQATNFLMHYVISLVATVVIVVFLIRLSHNIESNLLHKDQNLLRITRRLKASQQRFELAISGSNAGIYDWDIKNNIIYHAPMWKKLLGYKEDELDHFSIEMFYEFIHPEDVERARVALRGLPSHAQSRADGGDRGSRCPPCVARSWRWAGPAA